MMTGIGTPSSQSRIPRPMISLPCIEPAAFSNGYAACPVNAGRGIGSAAAGSAQRCGVRGLLPFVLPAGGSVKSSFTTPAKVVADKRIPPQSCSKDTALSRNDASSRPLPGASEWGPA